MSRLTRDVLRRFAHLLQPADNARVDEAMTPFHGKRNECDRDSARAERGQNLRQRALAEFFAQPSPKRSARFEMLIIILLPVV